MPQCTVLQTDRQTDRRYLFCQEPIILRVPFEILQPFSLMNIIFKTYTHAHTPRHARQLISFSNVYGEFDIGRFQELDLNVSAYVFSASEQEERWIDKVTVTLCEKGDYRLVRVPLTVASEILYTYCCFCCCCCDSPAALLLSSAIISCPGLGSLQPQPGCAVENLQIGVELIMTEFITV